MEIGSGNEYNTLNAPEVYLFILANAIAIAIYTATTQMSNLEAWCSSIGTEWWMNEYGRSYSEQQV